MPNAHIKLLLRLASTNASIVEMRRVGLEYSQIAMILDAAIAEGLVSLDSNGVILTDAGRALLVGSGVSQGLIAVDPDIGFISPRLNAKVEKAGVFDVYIPGRQVVRELLE